MIDYQKCYLLGLLVGGGSISNSTFLISLPFSKWGLDLKNMRDIAVDILTSISDQFQSSYGFNVQYEIRNRDWTIQPIGKISMDDLITDLKFLGLPTSGILLNSIDLSRAKVVLTELVEIENFLTGIFDARASLTDSHRRFANSAPIVSLEIPGATKNFNFIVQICSWLTALGSVTDQILYNHPCQQSPADPNYTNWKKGFKIRFLAKSFISSNSFALKAKAKSLTKMEVRQEKEEQLPCSNRHPHRVSPVSIHKDIQSDDLPEEVRGKLFFHYHHICAVLGCPFAPIDQIQKLARQYRSYISVLPRLEKGNVGEMRLKYESFHTTYFSDTSLMTFEYTVEKFMELERFKNYEEYKSGIAYLFSVELKGKRHKGGLKGIIEASSLLKLKVVCSSVDQDYPILILNEHNDRGAILSCVKGTFNYELVDKFVSVDGININVK